MADCGRAVGIEESVTRFGGEEAQAGNTEVNFGCGHIIRSSVERSKWPRSSVGILCDLLNL